MSSHPFLSLPPSPNLSQAHDPLVASTVKRAKEPPDTSRAFIFLLTLPDASPAPVYMQFLGRLEICLQMMRWMVEECIQLWMEEAKSSSKLKQEVHYLGSMGIYVINRDIMMKLLTEYFPKANDLLSEVIAGAISMGMKTSPGESGKLHRRQKKSAAWCRRGRHPCFGNSVLGLSAENYNFRE